MRSIELLRSKCGDLEGPVTLSPGTSYYAGLFSPYLIFRSAFAARLRKFESIEDIPFVEDEATISIEPATMTAPDIVKVVVQRDGTVVEPLRSSLAPQEFKNRLGGSVMLHSGSVTFPLSTFAPGATVIITLVPNKGETASNKLDTKRLAKFE
jgi:hypothetical protein